MREKETEQSSEIPTQFIREPQVGEIVTPFPISATPEDADRLNEIIRTAQKLSNIGTDYFSLEFGNDEVLYKRRILEDESHIPGGLRLVPTNLVTRYDAQGFPIASQVQRDNGSSIPDVRRVFNYSTPDDQGRRTVESIDTYLVLQAAPDGILVARQQQIDGETVAESNPKDKAYDRMINALFEFPDPLQANEIGNPIVQQAEGYIYENPQLLLRITEQSDTSLTLYTCGFLQNNWGDYLQYRKLRLEKRAEVWLPRYLGIYHAPGSTTHVEFLPAELYRFSYDDNNHLARVTAYTGEDLLAQETYLERDLPLYNQKGNKIRAKARVFDIQRIQYNPNEPGQPPVEKRFDFVQEVLLARRPGIGGNFGVSVVSRALNKDDQEVPYAVVVQDSQGQNFSTITNPDVVTVERTVKVIATGQRFRVSVKVANGIIDLNQQLKPVLLS